jgi:hypothetical protein
MNIEIAGKVFRKADDLTEKWRAAMLRVVDDLQMWLGVSDLATRIAPAQPAVTQRQSPSPVLTVPAGYDATEAENLLATAVATSPQSTKPANPNPIDAVARVVVPTEPVKEKVEPKSIAAQVDEILQEKLERSVLSNRYISIEELPGRGMVVIVDGEQYEGVSDVPDPAVRELLRQCVAEWEKRASGI